MAIYLGLLIFSFILTGIIIIPFIDLLYRLHFTHHHPSPSSFKEEEMNFQKISQSHTSKIGTPIGGGILIIALVTVLFVVSLFIFSKLGISVSRNFPINQELNILFFTFVSFGLVGLYDDIIKIFNLPKKTSSTMGPARKTIMIFLLSLLISCMLYINLHIQIVNLPLVGILDLGYIFIPFSTLIISFFAKAFDITDGLDGLASGTLLISLLAFWALSFSSLDSLLSIFIALWIGCLLAFLYFNVYPARIWLGNAGSLSFGGTLAVIGLLLGKTATLFFVGFIFVIEALSQLLQIISVTIFHRPLFPVTPLHYLLQSFGWPEPKIVLRMWLFTMISSIFGLWLTDL